MDFVPIIHPEQLLANIGALATQAGLRIMEYYLKDHNARAKQDHSPVTDADMAAHDLIDAALQQLTPGLPIVSEEDTTLHHLTPGETFWLVDPLDGTRSFVKGNGEFTVNIALIHARAPVFGAVYVPVQKILYYGGKNLGAFRRIKNQEAIFIHTRPPPAHGLTVIKSQSHAHPKTDAFLESFRVAEALKASSSLKFCKVAEGEADLYPRLNHTMEWDTAAGQAVLEGAGGCVTVPDGKPFLYGKPGFHNNEGFVAWGNSSLMSNAR